MEADAAGPAKRAKFSQTYRMRVAYRQEYKCAECQEMLHYTFEVDHEVPLFAGGSNDESNLQALCCVCHRKKSGAERRPLVTKLPTIVKCQRCGMTVSLYFKHNCTG
jgi:5-methylcytosine-specific restriction endonuclease McrA